jgi:hypothetical protein
MKVWLDKLNKILADEGYNYRYRITDHHRLGAKNPNRNKYPRYGNYRVKPQHAARTDLYLQKRYLHNKGLNYDDVPETTFEKFKETLREVCWRSHFIEV